MPGTILRTLYTLCHLISIIESLQQSYKVKHVISILFSQFPIRHLDDFISNFSTFINNTVINNFVANTSMINS